MNLVAPVLLKLSLLFLGLVIIFAVFLFFAYLCFLASHNLPTSGDSTSTTTSTFPTSFFDFISALPTPDFCLTGDSCMDFSNPNSNFLGCGFSAYSNSSNQIPNNLDQPSSSAPLSETTSRRQSDNSQAIKDSALNESLNSRQG